MRARVGIVADDLTGAADTGVAFRRAGLSVLVGWDLEQLPPAADAVAIDTGSRAAGAEAAASVTRTVVAAFRDAGFATLYKKIDSMLRGHIAVEVQAALDGWHPGSLGVVAPAFPATARTTVAGIQLVNGETTRGGGAIPALFERAGLHVRHLDLATVRGDLAAALRACGDAAVRVVVCDAVTDSDLEAIAEAGSHLPSPIVWIGSGGLARAIAAGLGVGNQPAPAVSVAGPILVVVGSRSPIALAQADEVAAGGARRVNMPLSALDADSTPEGTDIARRIEQLLLAGDDVVVSIEGGLGGDRSDDYRFPERLGVLLRPCSAATGGLILTGGDTATGVLRAWGVTALRLLEETDAGVVRSETLGERPLPVVTKAGAFGDRGTLRRALEKMRRVRMQLREREDAKRL